jgi:hypothetical protein
MGDEMHQNITGYTLRNLGYAAFEAYGMNLTQLRSCIDQDKPLILLMWYSSYHVSTHYRVATGYNDTHVFLHDPWNKPLWGGRIGGPNIAFNNTEFLDLWSYYGNWALHVSPWTANASAPTYIKPETPFQVNFTIAYPRPLPSALSTYPASMGNATITLPQNMSLAQGENQTKTVSSAILEAGANKTASWTVTANHSGTYTIGLEAEGLVSGSAWTHETYPAYDYSDRIGVAANITIELEEDSTPPMIGFPSRTPENEVLPFQEVQVFVNVTDVQSRVENVTLHYSLNNSTAWAAIPMDYNASSSLYDTTIPGQPEATYVRFKIVAYDRVGNNATRDGTEPYCIYRIIPEFPSTMVLPSLILTVTVIVCAKKGKNRSKMASLVSSNNHSQKWSRRHLSGMFRSSLGLKLFP